MGFWTNVVASTICIYHLPDDAVVIPSILNQTVPQYRFHAKNLHHEEALARLKVLFAE